MKTKLIQFHPVDQLSCTRQPRERFDEEKIAGLAQSFLEVGMLQPISVRRDGDKWVVIDGERRLRAAKLAGMANVPVVIEERELGASEVLQRQLIANCQRADLSPMEMASSIDQLMRETNWNAAQVAPKLGISPGTVSKLLALLTLPEDVRSQVHSGDIAVSAAYQLARVKDGKNQAQLASDVAGGLKRDQLAARVKATKSPDAETKPGPARVTAVLGDGRTVTMCGTGLTLESFIDWLQELLDKARKARPRGIALTTFLKMLKDQAKSTAESRG